MEGILIKCLITYGLLIAILVVVDLYLNGRNKTALYRVICFNILALVVSGVMLFTYNLWSA